MSFVLGFLIGGLSVYLIVSHLAELAFRAKLVQNSLGFETKDALDWMNTKNPGIGLRKPVELELDEFVEYLNKLTWMNL